MIYVPVSTHGQAKQYTVPPLLPTEWAYIACFLDTDGCIYIDRKRKLPEYEN